jgi:hypothetical protein
MSANGPHLVLIMISDAAASCDLFLFLSGGNFNMGDGRVNVDPPSDCLEAIATPRHFVALDYLYFPGCFSSSYCSLRRADIMQTLHLFNTTYSSTFAA